MQRMLRSYGIPVALLLAAAPAVAQTPQPSQRKKPQPTAASLVIDAKTLVQRESPAIVTIFNLDASGKPAAMGTGFIVRRDGVVVTNFHVIRGASDAQVKLKSGEIYDQVMVYDFDQRRDIAVLKIRANGLQTVTLGDSGKLVPGDKAYAIGNPEGYDYTVSDGLISARRVIDGTEKLQITVPISHGSSGGPLYNDHGEVVGITTEGIMEGAQLLNFAVPVKYLAPMLDSLPRNLTLAQVTAQTQPPAPASPAPSTSGGIGTIIGNKYTERTGQITVTLAEGWQPQPPPNGELMEITKGNGLLVLLSRNANVEANFQTGMDVAKKVFTDITPFSNVVQSDDGGRQLKAQSFTGYDSGKLQMKILVASITSSTAKLVCVGFTEVTAAADFSQLTEMFTSIEWK